MKYQATLLVYIEKIALKHRKNNWFTNRAMNEKPKRLKKLSIGNF